MPNLKIHQYQLYDIPMQQAELLRFISDTLDLIEASPDVFKNTKKAKALFHNSKHQYSAIQFGIKHKHLSMTAYGDKAIKILKKWWIVYQRENALQVRNKVVCKEQYSLGFLPVLQTYRLQNFLISKEKSQDLRQAENAAERQKIMEDYIMANFLPFFNHIGYWHERTEQDIVVKIDSYKRIRKDISVFKGVKLKGYNIIFKTNLRLPHILRLGQSTALGFGEVNWL